MKKEFYYVDELRIYIRLSNIVSFSCGGNIREYGQTQDRCCIVLFSETVYWCNAKHFLELKKIFNLND